MLNMQGTLLGLNSFYLSGLRSAAKAVIGAGLHMLLMPAHSSPASFSTSVDSDELLGITSCAIYIPHACDQYEVLISFC